MELNICKTCGMMVCECDSFTITKMDHDKKEITLEPTKPVIIDKASLECDVCHKPFVLQSGCLIGDGETICPACAGPEINRISKSHGADAINAILEDEPTPEGLVKAQDAVNTIQNQINERLIIKRTCEVCNKEGDWFKHSGMYMCPECRDKEMALQAKSLATADKRVADSKTDMLERLANTVESSIIPIDKLAEELPIDETIKVKSEYFNVKTLSIIDMKAQIDADTTIVNKHFELAARQKTRFLHLRTTLFDIKEIEVTITSEMRGIQQFFNTHVNNLRTKEREKLKLQDLTYQPIASKPISKSRKPKAPKFDKVELARLAKEIGIPEFTIQTICVAKGIQPQEAADELKKLQGN